MTLSANLLESKGNQNLLFTVHLYTPEKKIQSSIHYHSAYNTRTTSKRNPAPWIFSAKHFSASGISGEDQHIFIVLFSCGYAIKSNRRQIPIGPQLALKQHVLRKHHSTRQPSRWANKSFWSETSSCVQAAVMTKLATALPGYKVTSVCLASGNVVRLWHPSSQTGCVWKCRARHIIGPMYKYVLSVLGGTCHKPKRRTVKLRHITSSASRPTKHESRATGVFLKHIMRTKSFRIWNKKDIFEEESLIDEMISHR